MGIVTKTKTWADNDLVNYTDINANFDTLYNLVNGQLDNNNISGSAAISVSKVAFGGASGQFITSNGLGGVSYSSLTLNRSFGFFILGTAAVANDLSWNPLSPQAMTAIKIWAYARTAPVGSVLTVQVYNVSQTRIVATLSIADGINSGSSTTIANAAISAGDILRVDVTAVGSTTAGANVSVVLECTQP